MKKYCFLFFWIFSCSVHAQSVSGTVRAADSKKPISLASVFFSNTSFGTVTNEQGQFNFSGLPAGKFELVVSYLGYETQVQTIETDKQTKPIEIVLKLKPKELDNVIVEPYEKDNWERWGNFFIENFIGRSSYAADCKIKNTKAISFRNYRRSNRLAAFADEQLIIDNKALGYRIKYQLEKFEYNFKTRVFFFQGFPLFEEMETKATSRRKKWDKRRLETYNGSLMHFMRSLYRNQLIENQFQVRHMRQETNLEKERVKAIMRQGANTRITTNRMITIGTNQAKVAAITDSSSYYDRILQQPDLLDIVDPTLLIGDSIAFAIDTTTAGLIFENFLHITYLGKKEPIEYARSQGRGNQFDYQVSHLELLNNKNLSVSSNGSFYNPADMMLYAFWAFWEKISTMLPFDYQPIVIDQ